MKLKNQSGQGLIEYLVLVALMGVAAIGVVRILSHVVNAKFAEITNGLAGKTQKIQTQEVDESYYRMRDLGDFFEKSSDKTGRGK